ncbi:MAG: response regulator transcription factor [Luteolibacter sp.]
MTSSKKHTVAILEDHSKLGILLKEIVDSSPNLTCTDIWSTGEEALEKIGNSKPDVILMDINLPGISGIEVTESIKQKFPGTQIIMVTVYGDHDRIFAALKAGASGYLLKSSSPNQVLDAIQDVLTGGAPMTPEIARRVVETFHRPEKKVSSDLELSSREIEVLDLVADGLANKEVAAHLNIATGTVRVHLRNIYDKLHVHSRVAATRKYLKYRKRQ